MTMRLWAALAGLMLLAAGLHAQQADDRILAARDAAGRGDRATLDRLAAARDPHVLDPYVRYWALSNALVRQEPPPAAALEDFLLGEAGSMLAERLRAEWLRRLAKDGEWTAYLRLYADVFAPDLELRCHAWHARVLAGDVGALDEAAAEWDALTESPPACDGMLTNLVAGGRIGEEQVWWRFRRQIDTRTPANARSTLALLRLGDAPAASRLDALLRDPAAYLDRLSPGFTVSRGEREFALAALTRLARSDVRSAYLRYQRIASGLRDAEQAYGWAVLAHRAATDHLPQALDWFGAAGTLALSREQRAWRVRAALRAEDWRAAQAAIEALPAAEQALPEWVYWLARAHRAQGRRAEADALFDRIAGEPHFYGLLADEALGHLFVAPSRNGSSTPEDRRRAAEDPGLCRALALFRLDMRTEAVREWNWALRGQDEAFLLAAARLALEHGLYDRVINTAERLDPHANYELRFLTPFRDTLEPQVARQGLDIGWVYGLIRQESRFVVPARSSAGAQGLMQVMPATGKWVAGKIGLSGYHPRMLADPATNVLLGTSYMRLILEGLDNHPVLASAGYNAGPGRARRWRDARALEGAIYAETIPFDETRDYVKKVLANTVIYAAMLEGRPQSLGSRLGTIAARPAEIAE